MARVTLTADNINSCMRLVLNAESVGLTPDQFFQPCSENPELRLELTARKEIIIMPPAGSESGAWNFNVIGQLARWIKKDGRGLCTKNERRALIERPYSRKAQTVGAVYDRPAFCVQSHGRGIGFDSSTGFTFPNGAVRAPDAACVLWEKWNNSESETLTEQKRKMAEYIGNGVRLGWLLDPFKRQVYVYRPGRSPEHFDDPDSITGDPELPGFTLNLREVW